MHMKYYLIHSWGKERGINVNSLFNRGGPKIFSMHFKIKRIFLPLVVYSFFLAVKRKKWPSRGNSFCTITRDFMVVNFPLEFEALTWIPGPYFWVFWGAGTRFIPVVSKFKKIDWCYWKNNDWAWPGAELWVPHAVTRPSSLALSMAFADFFSPEKKKRKKKKTPDRSLRYCPLEVTKPRDKDICWAS